MLTIDESRPYYHPTEEEWDSVEPKMFPIEDLVLSQCHGTTVAFIAIQTYGDNYPPVRLVTEGEKTHVHDGHHRVLSNYIKNKKFVWAKRWA